MEKKANSKDFLMKSSFFIITLCLSTYFVLWIERLKPSDLGTYKNMFIKEVIIKKRSDYNLKKPVPALSAEEKNFARIAWKYFENNCNASTGLVGVTEGSTFFTLSELSSYLMALASAYEVGVIDSAVFDNRIKTVFTSLEKLPLYENKLPNVRYSITDLAMLNDQNKPSASGTGWSALDIGRFYGFVQKVLVDYPSYVPLLKKVIDRWNIRDMVIGGSIYGIGKDDEGQTVKELQGKLGYEEFCSKGLLLTGFDVTESMAYTDFLKFVEINNIDVAVDTRIMKGKTEDNYIVSDPFILDGLEFGWDANSKELARRIYEVQMRRYEKEKTVTALSEDFIPSAPFYVYNTLYKDGKKFSCVDAKGNDASEYRMLSTKAAFGWSVLYKDAYSEVLLNAVKTLYDPNKGWYAGKFEKTGLADKSLSTKTNAMVLEAMNYKLHGRLIRL